MASRTSGPDHSRRTVPDVKAPAHTVNRAGQRSRRAIHGDVKAHHQEGVTHTHSLQFFKAQLHYCTFFCLDLEPQLTVIHWSVQYSIHGLHHEFTDNPEP